MTKQNMTLDTSRNNVVKVYSGKPGCMCGCRGKWSYASSAKDIPSYGVCNDTVVSRIYNEVMKNPSKTQEDDYVFVDTDKRVWMVVFEKESV